jgi:hypothetical protein
MRAEAQMDDLKMVLVIEWDLKTEKIDIQWPKECGMVQCLGMLEWAKSQLQTNMTMAKIAELGVRQKVASISRQ